MGCEQVSGPQAKTIMSPAGIGYRIDMFHIKFYFSMLFMLRSLILGRQIPLNKATVYPVLFHRYQFSSIFTYAVNARNCWQEFMAQADNISFYPVFLKKLES